MMITIHGLAPTTKYADVKKMIKQECNIDDFILDNLLNESDGTKKVRIGLTDENEGFRIMKCLDGYRLPGNYIVKVSPVGSKAVPSGLQSGYDARSAYQDPQRNDYANQPRSDYNSQINSNEYSRGPHGPNMPRGPGGPHGAGGPHGPPGQHGPGGPNKPYGSSGPHSLDPSDMRPVPWTSNSNTSNQWGPNSSMTSQIPQNSFGYGSGPHQQNAASGYIPQHSVPHPEVRPFVQGRQGPPPEQNYGGYLPKNNVPGRRNLRSIDTRDDGNEASSSIPEYGGRFPPNQYQQDKPVTIMKDNFQGPTPFNINHPSGSQPQQYQQRTANPSWQQPPNQQKPEFAKTSPLPFTKSFEERKYVQGDSPRDTRDPKRFQSKPDTYKEYEKRRGYSPTSRDPLPRRISPARREELHRDPAGRREELHRDPAGRREEMHRDPAVRREELHRDPAVRRDELHRDPAVRGEELLRDPAGRREELLRDPAGRREELHRDPASRREELHRDPASRREELQRDPAGRREELLRGPATKIGDMGRMDPTQRRVSPPGRRDEPHGRRYSPSGKRISPAGERRAVPGPPGPRRDSPPRRLSPSRRLVSPGRRDERQIPRYSPGRHHSDKMVDKFGQDSKDLKKIRPAYEPSAHAPNQAMYSGGFRSSIHDHAPYSVPGMREEQSGPWQRHIDDSTAPMKKQEDDRRDSRMQMIRERGSDKVDKRYSPTRKSRSPNRRDRSPLRDRFKRNSVSPRSSYSPRRSWALEKRRSPDAPPPPVWPGQNTNRPNRPNFPEKDEKPKHQPVWEGRSFKEEELRNRRPEERRAYDEAKLRVAKELLERATAPAGTSDRYQPKFSPRDDYEERRDNYRRRDLPDRKPHADDFDLPRRPREEDRHDEYNRRRESPRRESKVEPSKDFDKDFEDIYNRAMQFKKKAEELRKSGSRKRDDFDDSRRPVEKMTGDIRQRYEDHGRDREEESLRQRDDRTRDDRPRQDGAHREDYRLRDSEQIDRDRRIDPTTSSSIRQKREKAIEEIAQKILDKSEEHKHIEGEQRQYIIQELKKIVANLIYDMFGDSEISFIEVIIKYQAKYNLKDEAKILQDVMRSMPKQLRNNKRHAPESSDIPPAKTSRVSTSADLKQDSNMKLATPPIISMPCPGVPPPQHVMAQPMMPMMVPPPFYQTFDNIQHNYHNPMFGSQPVPPVAGFPQPIADFAKPAAGFPQPVAEFQQPVPDFAPPSFSEEDDSQGYRLYLCRDDFDRISHMEADLLKDYLISKMFEAAGQFQGWTPDFTFKGLQSLLKYEVVTKDTWSRDWLLNLDFKDFEYFGVLVYTKEELWYERAAIWLPGHSRVRNIEPLEKLKLQNKKLDGVNVDKWKYVKKIINEKGTRLYVDMPPSSARALESHDMKLSYELQQVNVYLKAVAVDKDSFDLGLKENSDTDSFVISKAIKNSTIPALNNERKVVKIILKGSKTLDLVQARKIKEVVIYNIFQYHRDGGVLRTDFVKYGFLKPNYFAILPENQESKQWLLSCNFGKVNRQAVVVVGGEDDTMRYFKMTVLVPFERQLRAVHLIQKLKHSNQGVKNINFNLWKAVNIKSIVKNKLMYEVEIDLESLETLASMRYQLDYIDTTGLHAVCFKSEYSQSELDNIIKNYKAEITDSYDVANMDLESKDGSESNDDIICLD